MQRGGSGPAHLHIRLVSAAFRGSVTAVSDRAYVRQGPAALEGSPWHFARGCTDPQGRTIGTSVVSN